MTKFTAGFSQRQELLLAESGYLLSKVATLPTYDIIQSQVNHARGSILSGRYAVGSLEIPHEMAIAVNTNSASDLFYA